MFGRAASGRAAGGGTGGRTAGGWRANAKDSRSLSKAFPDTPKASQIIAKLPNPPQSENLSK